MPSQPAFKAAIVAALVVSGDAAVAQGIIQGMPLTYGAIEPIDSTAAELVKKLDAALAIQDAALRESLGTSGPLVSAIDVEQLDIKGIAVAYRDKLAPKLLALQALSDSFRSKLSGPLEELNKLVQKQAILADREQRDTFALTIEKVEQNGKGWLGRDAASGKQVYVETTAYVPSRIDQTLIYRPIQGEFVQDGSMPGQNGFGVPVSVPRFVDSKSVERDHLRALQETLKQAIGRVDDAGAKTLKDAKVSLTSIRNAMLSRCAALATTVPDADLIATLSELKVGEADFVNPKVVDMLGGLLGGIWQGSIPCILARGREPESNSMANVKAVVVRDFVAISVDAPDKDNGIDKRDYRYGLAGKVVGMSFVARKLNEAELSKLLQDGEQADRAGRQDEAKDKFMRLELLNGPDGAVTVAKVERQAAGLFISIDMKPQDGGQPKHLEGILRRP